MTLTKAFSKAAKTYDTHAHIQTQAADILFTKPLPQNATHILEIGCGTGYLTQKLLTHYPNAHITAIDLSEEMLQEAQKKISAPNITFQKSDILTFESDQTYDLIISSSTLHWVTPTHVLVKKLHSLLTSQGTLLFSCFGPNTFHELANATQHPIPAQKFPKFITWSATLASRFTHTRLTRETHTKTYPTLYTLLKNIQKTGTHNPTAPPIWTHKKLQRLDTNYRQKYHAIIATYELLFIVARGR
ncbi:MAG: malonyl-[acyl-carrier protein] O-methyltransferase BioC [Candidatus Margulisbacteria bacterium]|nr:malonyl-[acyl-carrier protein] O-methyltransferase BioC [Candidatus Margulisiibacteriota bacterium]